MCVQGLLCLLFCSPLCSALLCSSLVTEITVQTMDPEMTLATGLGAGGVRCAVAVERVVRWSGVEWSVARAVPSRDDRQTGRQAGRQAGRFKAGAEMLGPGASQCQWRLQASP